MEDIRPEIRQALKDMNWEDRLEKARAQREQVLRDRAANPAGKAPSVDIRKGPVAADPPMAHRAPAAAEPPSPAASPAVSRGGTRRVFGLAGLGIAAGVGALAAVFLVLNAPQENVLPGAEGTATAAAPSPGSGPVAASERVASPQVPAEREQAVPEASQVVAEAPVVLADMNTVLSPPEPALAGDVPASIGAPVREPARIAVLETPRIANLPGTDPQPPAIAATLAASAGDSAPSIQVSVVSTMPGGREPVEMDSGSIRLVSADARGGRLSDEPVSREAGQRLHQVGAPQPATGGIAVSDPQRPVLVAALNLATAEIPETGPGIELGHAGDGPAPAMEPGRLAAAPATSARPGADPVPPKPMIPGAGSMRVSVFAASTVEDDIVTAAQGVAEELGLPILQVTRVGYRISENQVRFYHEASAAAASRLAADIGAVARDFTGSNADPPEGTLEVYLAGEAAEAPPPRPVASTRPPVRQPQASPTDRLRDSVISRLRSGASR